MLPLRTPFALPILAASICWSYSTNQQLPRELIRVNANLVLVDVKVVNKETGRTVQGLKVEDYELYEDGVQQEIKHFSPDRLPLSVLLLLDVSNSMQSVIKQLRQKMGGEFRRIQIRLKHTVADEVPGKATKLVIVMRRGYYARAREDGKAGNRLP